MQSIKGVAVLVLAVFLASCGGCKSTSQSNQQSNSSPAKMAKWVAQYRSPASAAYSGTALSLFFYSSISVVSDKVVFVGGDMPVGAPGGEDRVAVVLKTTDGGEQWSETPITAPGMQIPTLNAIHFVDSETGWAVGVDSTGGGVLLATTTGAATWSAKRLEGKQIPTSVFFADAQTGWLGGATPIEGDDEGGPSAILATSDGGLTWRQQINLPVSIYDVFFLDKLAGWAAGSRGAIYHTNDGGLTWNSQRSEIESLDSIAMRGESQPSSRASGSKGGGGKQGGSPDRSRLEQLRDKSFRIMGIHFADRQNGFAAAAAEGEDNGRLLSTGNGGAAWRQQWIVADSGLRDIYFANANEGWAVADRGGYVYHTTDGGRYWVSEPKVFEQDVSVVRVAGSDSAHVWAVGGAAVFVRVTE
jgi:photosystem II stability/assembly factor-like uncharacterized protein